MNFLTLSNAGVADLILVIFNIGTLILDTIISVYPKSIIYKLRITSKKRSTFCYFLHNVTYI